MMSCCQRRRPPMLRTAGWVLAIAAIALALGACAGQPASPSAPSASGTAAAPPDPSARGPYAVGVTRRSLTRSSTTSGLPRTLDTAVWYPAQETAASLPPAERLAAPLDVAAERAGGPYPVILLSSGAGGGPAGATFFT